MRNFKLLLAAALAVTVQIGSAQQAPVVAPPSAAPAASAPTRFAVVNVEQLYRNYGVAQEGEKVLQAKVAEIKAAIERKVQVRQLLVDQAQLAQADIAKARDAKDEAAVNAATTRFQQITASITDTEKEGQALGNSPELAKAIQDQRDKVSTAIKAATKKVGLAKHYSIVLDSSVTNAIQVPMIAVIDDTPDDLTAAVLAELNAPPAKSASTAAPVTKTEGAAAPAADFPHKSS